MNINTHKYASFIFIGINYFWIVGSALSILTTEDFYLCYDVDQNLIKLILFGSFAFFAIGILYHSCQKIYYRQFYLKFYNRVFVIFSLIVTIIGIARSFNTIEKTIICPNLSFLNKYFTLTYSIIFVIFVTYNLFFCFLELMIRFYFALKCCAFSFFNCCCYNNCFFSNVEGIKFVYNSPTKRINFLIYITKLYREGTLDIQPSLNYGSNGHHSNPNMSGLSEAEQKKIIFAL